MTWPFFLSVAASAPRTECFCHAVAVASSSMLAPFGERSSATSASSFDVPLSAAVFGVVRRGLGADVLLVMVRAFLVSGANPAPLPARARVAGRATNAHFARAIHRKVADKLRSPFVLSTPTAISRP